MTNDKLSNFKLHRDFLDPTGAYLTLRGVVCFLTQVRLGLLAVALRASSEAAGSVSSRKCARALMDTAYCRLTSGGRRSAGCGREGGEQLYAGECAVVLVLDRNLSVRLPWGKETEPGPSQCVEGGRVRETGCTERRSMVRAAKRDDELAWIRKSKMWNLVNILLKCFPRHLWRASRVLIKP